MKKLIKIILFVLGLILLFIIGLVIYVGVSVFDKTDNTSADIINQNKETSELLNQYIYSSLKNTEESKSVDLTLGENEMNFLLYSISKDIDIPYINVNSIYCVYSTDNNIDLFAPITCFGFKSCFKGTLSITRENEEFNISVLNPKIGKLSSDNIILKNVIFSANNIKKINKEIQNKNLGFDIKFSNGSFTAKITKDDILKLVSEKVTDDNKNLYLALIEEFVGNDQLLKFYFNNNDKTGLNLNLEQMLNTYILQYDIENELKEKMDDVKKLLVNKIIDYKNIGIVFDYLVRGYSKMSSANKTTIDSLDLSSIGIDNKDSYQGIISRGNMTMADIIEDNTPNNFEEALTEAIADKYFDIKISSENINKILNSLDFIGTSFAFTDGTDVSFITIESLMLKVESDVLTANLIMDFNGEKVSCYARFEEESSSSKSITLKLIDINLGSVKVEEKVEKYILDYLTSVTENPNMSFMKIDATKELITFDFSSYLSSDNLFFNLLIKSKLDKMQTILDSDNNGFIIRYSALE